ncbi:MAG TPA: hypothetical protein VGI03_13785 [Verrucomicrobiae bacterium]|jgi:hypothetical protein
MSLINDALKRAHESQGPPPGAPPSPLVPVASPSRGGLGWFGLVLSAVIVLLLAAGGIFVWAAFAHKTSKQPPAPVPAVAVSPTPQTPQAITAPAPAPVVASQPIVTNPPPPANKTAVTELLPDSWPKVQGIIYTQPRPMAIVNGKAVSVGDQLGHYVVKQITQHDVLFQGDDGSLKQLGVGQ